MCAPLNQSEDYEDGRSKGRALDNAGVNVKDLGESVIVFCPVGAVTEEAQAPGVNVIRQWMRAESLEQRTVAGDTTVAGDRWCYYVTQEGIQ